MAGDIGFAAADKGLGVASAGQDGRPQGPSGVAATPLRWVASFPEGSSGFWYVDSAGHDYHSGDICTVWGAGAYEEAAKNARLIAAAPELLTALLRLAKAVAHGDVAGLLLGEEPAHWSNIADALADVDAALSKAEGRS